MTGSGLVGSLVACYCLYDGAKSVNALDVDLASPDLHLLHLVMNPLTLALEPAS
jgi:MinD-like ATPase involved in chromosome partitioning or flagellar assembly